MSADSRKRLCDLRGELLALVSYPWATIETWSAKALAIIRRDWPNDLDDCRRLLATPSWTALPVAFGRNEEENRATSARVQTMEDLANRATAEQAKKRILSYLDGLLLATEMSVSRDGHDPIAIRQEILQAILEIQGNSNVGTNDRHIADRLGLTVAEVEGHLEILRDEGKLNFSRSSGGCAVFLMEGQKQRFKESQMTTRRTSSLDSKMPKIFISYRRDDSAYASQDIYDTLVSHFSQEAVFFDVDSIPKGMDFHGILNETVEKCDLLLAVIGDHWLNATDETGQRRLDNPDDFVRIEIEAALSRNIPVIPVLLGRATVPKPQELPPTLKNLSRRQAAEVRFGRDFRSHLERLVRDIEQATEAADSDGADAHSLGQ